VDPSPLAWDKGGGFAKARAMELGNILSDEIISS
jgi:hypothetical protein